MLLLWVQVLCTEKHHKVIHWKKPITTIQTEFASCFHGEKGCLFYNCCSETIEDQNWYPLTKYLGVTFDVNLTWKNHIDELCLKLSKTVGVVSKLRYYVINIDVPKILYTSLIYPFFYLWCPYLGSNIPNVPINPLTTLQKHLVRIMTFSEPQSHSEPLLKSLNLLKFCDIIHVEILSFVYQWFHKLTPSCFADYFKQISSVYLYYTPQSNNENLFVNKVQTSQYGLRSFCFSGVKLWNSLPLDVK